MSAVNRRAEFFAMEAGEYLAQLEPLAARADHPDLERLVRGARALRGAALMAGLGTFARAAAGLESVARQVRDHALAWEPQARSGWREGLQTLRGLVARAPSWEAADDRQALALADFLERIASGQAGKPPAPPPPDAVPVPPIAQAAGLTAGVRAFIARESELIAGTLLEAARALAPIPPTEALAGVLERMRSLRGVGGAGELSPLPELLDAMEATTRSLLSDPAPPPDVAGVFADAADALSAMARSVAQEGRVVTPAGLDHVARRLLTAFTATDDVVPIAGLAPEGADPIVSRGAPPAVRGSSEPVPIELVGVGDHLLLVADALQHHATPAARDLRLFVMHRTLATMPVRSGTGHFIAPIARAISAQIADGTATSSPERFVAHLRQAGQFLLDAGNAPQRDAAIGAARDRLVHELGGEPPAVTPAGVPEAPAAPVVPTVGARAVTDVVVIETTVTETVVTETIVAIADLDYDAQAVEQDGLAVPEDERDVVAIASLDYEAPGDAAPEDAIVPIEALAPEGEHGPGRLERAYRRRATVGASERADGDVIDIANLLYRGASALARAEQVRGELSAILAGPSVPLERLRPLLDELLDLVPLARDAA
jgi:hypothetical protein